MTIATATPSISSPGRFGIRPLPLLTAVNFFNYLDRQVVYSMTPFLAAEFGISKFRLGLLSLVNLVVFALASLISGPIADRVGPRRVIFCGIALWSIATMGSAVSTSFPMLLFFRALVGLGEGAYGPSANALLCAAAPPEKRGQALGIYNTGMAIGGSAGLFLGAVLAPEIGWRNVFWIAGAPSMLLALASAFISAPARIARPQVLPARAYLMNPTYLVCFAGGILVTFGVSGLLFWSRWLIIDERGFSVLGGSSLMLAIGVFCGIGGVVTGGIIGDRIGRTRPGGHALVCGVSLLTAVPLGLGCLLITNKPTFALLTALTVLCLSMYNGPAAVVVDQLAPPQYAATLQAVFLFGIHVLGDAPAGSVIGLIGGSTTVANSLLVTIVAFALSGALFLYAARRLGRELPRVA
ncbi:MAG: MFS transporter [Deltaproteobacteria bacterium]|nr:MFS transporter [Deltaproteobacteria bacterium]